MWGVARAPSEARCQDDGSRACGPSQHDGYREQGTRPPQHGRRLGPTDPEAPSSRGIQRLRAREGSRGSELERDPEAPSSRGARADLDSMMGTRKGDPRIGLAAKVTWVRVGVRVRVRGER